MLDFHNHLMPGVDDGAVDIAESRAALASMQAQGIRTVITTPHIRASLLGRPSELEEYLNRVEIAWQALTELATAEFSAMRVERGFEVMLDVPRIDLSDPRLRLAAGRFVLVEFPFFTIPPNSAQALFDIKIAGYNPIVAHPERYENVLAEMETVSEWRRVGGFLQLDAGSVLGQYGPYATEAAWAMLKLGWIEYLCSDYHARGECASAAALEVLKKHDGAAQVGLIAYTNPDRVAWGDDPLEVPPLRERRSLWRFVAR